MLDILREALELLRCPYCDKSMELVETESNDTGEVIAGKLQCFCNEVWDISQGVVDFKSEEQEQGSRWSEELDKKSLAELDQEVKEKTPANHLELQEEALDLVSKQVQGKKPKRILDVATGRGMLMENIVPYLNNGTHVFCIDLSLAVLKAVRVKLKSMNPRARITYIACDATTLPFKDKSFDIAVSLGMANMGALFPKGVAEIRRVLETEGTFLNTSILIRQDSQSFRLLHKYYGGKAGDLLDIMLEPGFQEFHRKLGFEDVQLRITRESIAGKHEDMIPVEGDSFYYGIAIASNR